MTDTKLLRSIIDDKGIKLDYLRKALNISYSTLRRKIDNQSQFTAEEIDTICYVLDIKDLKIKEQIFFCRSC